MAQEKPTSLRILQTPKKKSVSPLLFSLVGFVTGVGVTLIAFFIIFQPSINVATTPEQQTPHVLEATTTDSAPHAVSGSHAATETSHSHSLSSSNETDESEATIQQPKESELSQLFSHTPTGVAAQRNASLDHSSKPQPKVAINKTTSSLDGPNTAKNFADPFPTQRPQPASKKTEESQTVPATVTTPKSTEAQ